MKSRFWKTTLLNFTLRSKRIKTKKEVKDKLYLLQDSVQLIPCCFYVRFLHSWKGKDETIIVH